MNEVTLSDADLKLLGSEVERHAEALGVSMPPEVARRLVAAIYRPTTRVTARVNVDPLALEHEGYREYVEQDVRRAFWRAVAESKAVPLYAPEPRWGTWGSDQPEQPTTPEEVSRNTKYGPLGYRMHFCEMSAPARQVGTQSALV